MSQKLSPCDDDDLDLLDDLLQVEVRRSDELSEGRDDDDDDEWRAYFSL